MKVLTRIFLWLSLLYHALPSAMMVFLAWGPLYLAITEGREYNWPALIGNVISLLLGFIITLAIYRSITAKEKTLSRKKTITLAILLLAYVGLSITFALIWVSIIVAIGLGIILIYYPRLIKKF